MSEPKVGDKCWIWGLNSRSYNAAGRLSTRGHFREATITGETRTSWIVGGSRYRKDTRWLRDPQWSSHSRLFLTESDVDDYCFVQDHAYKISEAVRQLGPDTLRLVARTIGYVIEEKS